MSTPTPRLERHHFRQLHRLRVRWAEVDLQQIVFNGHYLMYFDTAVAEHWRALALPYGATMAALGGDLFVRKAELEYHASARYDDQLEIGVRCLRIGRTSMVLGCAVFRGVQRLVDGELVYVHADAKTHQPLPVPEALRAVFLGYEAGEPMLQVAIGDWATLGADAHAIRREVFVDEQKVPADLEHDAADLHIVTHALARNRLGLALATGRWVPQDDGRVARIGRMAVRASMRGSAVGRQVLDALLASARAAGCREALLHAQASAIGFYLRAGFQPQGERFVEAGIEHLEMVKAL
ncbi:YbgC/FadM family acyl-CoA thioesterase [Sphaerotilus mobilis]|uniref:YbgC/YbaW family acyl-CoA thioester hydrolase n=1 Tax=Sphaerotilus mobilis TaxID=47994 RepID=A0A4Q7LQ79_9BURK|nr:YbgC/FadM family acyl-CoA thioesterase [Sphaerotilus mobilis]RZS56764.1 YbgC/YbaW family acyl-CoA thioester hydrolase [Sphaerotilus mobilis]